MSETNNLKTTVESLMKGMDGLVSSKTVVGDAVRVDNITILPLIDVSFGIGAGSNLSDKKVWAESEEKSHLARFWSSRTGQPGW